MAQLMYLQVAAEHTQETEGMKDEAPSPGAWQGLGEQDGHRASSGPELSPVSAEPRRGARRALPKSICSSLRQLREGSRGVYHGAAEG